MSDLIEMKNLSGNGTSIRASPGKNANISGQLCEIALVQAFKSRGVQVLPYQRQVTDLFLKKTLRTNVPYTNPFGTRSRSEFVYYDGGLSVRIECRSQQTPGSVDEKVCHLLECAKVIKDEPVSWIVISGLGARRRAIDWLKRNAHSYSQKIIRVYTEDEAKAAIKGLIEEGIADFIPNYKPRIESLNQKRLTL